MEIEKLEIEAREVAEKAYAPYSNFKVGCAILTKSGNIYTGCNMENSSYGLTTCAERNAIAKAVSEEGKLELAAIVVYTPTKKPASPCGVCRQVIHEFSRDDIPVISYCDGKEVLRTSIKSLLPEAFTLSDFNDQAK